MKEILKTILFCIFICFNAHLYAQSDIIINPNGGSSRNLEDGLKIVIATSNGSLHVYRENIAQYCCGMKYPGKDENHGVRMTFRFESYYSCKTQQCNYVNCSVTPAKKNGKDWTASIAGHVISSISHKKFYVTVNFSYTYPNKYFTVDYYVRAPLDLESAEAVHLYLDHDAHVLGHDGSRGYEYKDRSGHLVGNYREWRDNGCMGKIYSPRFPSHHGFKVSDEFRSWYSGYFENRNETDANDGKLANKISTSCQDDGIAVEFLLLNERKNRMLSAGETGVRRVLHCYGDDKGEFNTIQVVDPALSSRVSSKVNVSFTTDKFTEKEGAGAHTAQNIKIRVAPAAGGNGVLAQDQVCTFSISGGTAVQNTDYSYQTGFVIPAGDYSTPKELTLDNVHILDNVACNADRTFDIELVSTGCNDLLNVAGTKKASVTIENETELSLALPANQVCVSGETVPSLKFVSSSLLGVSYAWTNSQPSIGLAAGGSDGTIPSFTAVNTGNDPLVSTVTLSATRKGCKTSKNFTITVYPASVRRSLPANPNFRGKFKP
jgi:hypothetical protein